MTHLPHLAECYECNGSRRKLIETEDERINVPCPTCEGTGTTCQRCGEAPRFCECQRQLWKQEGGR